MKKVLGFSSAALMASLMTLCARTPAVAQTFTVLYSFTGTAGDGRNPVARLIRDAAGDLYGTTEWGGSFDLGTVFELSTAGTLTVLHNFAGGADGLEANTGLATDTSGNFYGITWQGGSYGYGTLFKASKSGKEKILHNFAGGVTDGENPVGDLVRDAADNFYGTTYYGGSTTCLNAPGCGTIFKLDKTGTLALLHVFSGTFDGANPVGPLVLDAAGDLYGTTTFGGSTDQGTAFKLDTTGTLTRLHIFGSGADGAQPAGGLVRDAAGSLYGVTYKGGTYNYGTIFEINTAGTETVLYNFTGGTGDAANPSAGLVRDTQGNLYGTTVYGGASNLGTVFKLSTTGAETVLHSFVGTDGEYPYARLTLDASGNLYGTNSAGGDTLCNAPSGCGVVFELTP